MTYRYANWSIERLRSKLGQLVQDQMYVDEEWEERLINKDIEMLLTAIRQKETKEDEK